MDGIATSKARHKALAKALKQRACATTVRVNYVGTGSKAHRRQLWVNFANGLAVDMFVEGLGDGACVVMLGGCIRPAGICATAEHANIENAVEFVVAKLGDFGALKAA